ncbi:MAG: PqqD family protein [Ignavibacteriales bacterium]|nr:PqqD family protein [Ignavibacteriales bacterium]
MFKKKNKSEINLLGLTPFHNREFEVSSNNRVTLLEPKFTNKILVRFLVPRLKSKNLRISLDEIGSETWLLINGNNNVSEICSSLRMKFGDDMKQVEERVTKFLTDLHQHDVIKFKELLKS